MLVIVSFGFDEVLSVVTYFLSLLLFFFFCVTYFLSWLVFFLRTKWLQFTRLYNKVYLCNK